MRRRVCCEGIELFNTIDRSLTFGVAMPNVSYCRDPTLNIPQGNVTSPS